MEKTLTLKHPDGEAHITELPNGKRRLTIACHDSAKYVPMQSCETSYPHELIELTLKVQGLPYLCEAISRDEDPEFVRTHLETNLFAYFDVKSFAGKRLMDFGCGSGSSTMCLADMLPETEIVGVELNGKLMLLANARLQFHGFKNAKFYVSPKGTELPADIGEFDFCMMSAVYEHLLPEERAAILPKVWSKIKPGGALFINQTPHRYYPLETHSTGLPLINYLPDSLAFFLARRWSRMQSMHDYSRDDLLRGGIRGATEYEIMRIIERSSGYRPILLEPHHGGYDDRIDLWYAGLNPHRWRAAKFLLKQLFKTIKSVSGNVLLQNLTLAIQKDEVCRSKLSA